MCRCVGGWVLCGGCAECLEVAKRKQTIGAILIVVADVHSVSAGLVFM
jgi:hypothetical protein